MDDQAVRRPPCRALSHSPALPAQLVGKAWEDVAAERAKWQDEVMYQMSKESDDAMVQSAWEQVASEQARWEAAVMSLDTSDSNAAETSTMDSSLVATNQVKPSASSPTAGSPTLTSQAQIVMAASEPLPISPSLEVITLADAFSAPRSPYQSYPLAERLKRDRERLDLIQKELRDIMEAKIAAHETNSSRLMEWKRAFAQRVIARLEEDRIVRLKREAEECQMRQKAIAQWENDQVMLQKERAALRIKVEERIKTMDAARRARDAEEAGLRLAMLKELGVVRRVL